MHSNQPLYLTNVLKDGTGQVCSCIEWCAHGAWLAWASPLMFKDSKETCVHTYVCMCYTFSDIKLKSSGSVAQVLESTLQVS